MATATAPSEDFTKGSSKTLVATDVAARGLDVEDITLVVCCLDLLGGNLSGGTSGDFRRFFLGTGSQMLIWLVVTGTMESYDFPYIGNGIMTPTDELWQTHIFQRGRYTTNQLSLALLLPARLLFPWEFYRVSSIGGRALNKTLDQEFFKPAVPVNLDAKLPFGSWFHVCIFILSSCRPYTIYIYIYIWHIFHVWPMRSHICRRSSLALFLQIR